MKTKFDIMNKNNNKETEQCNALNWWNNPSFNPSEKSALLHKHNSSEYGKFTNRISQNEIVRIFKLEHCT